MTPTHSERRQLLLIPLAALVAVLPLILHGCSCGHDFDFHLLNWMEVARQFSHGHLDPHWAATPAFNAGEPRFVFYPPLSWVLGALLGLLLTHLPGVGEAAGWTAVAILFTWIALTASGLTLYRLARTLVSANAAVLAATIYIVNPYMLFTAYERTAYAELLAAAWIPLLFHAILRDRVTIPGIALPVALLWLTNAPAAVMGCYALALLAAIRVFTNPGVPEPTLTLSKGLDSETWVSRHRSSLQLALKTIGGTALGLGLAAFYIIPAACERRFVHIAMATITGMRIDQNFLFEHTGFSPDAIDHDQVLHTASLVAVILLAATAITLRATALHRKPKPPASAFPTFPLVILTAAIAFLLTPFSLPLWNHAPEATFLQFPWRLLAIVAPIFALAAANCLDRFSLKFSATAVAAVVLAAVLTYPAVHVFRQRCYPEDTTPARLDLFHSNDGTDPTDEYTPTTADNDVLKPNNPPYWLADSANAAAPATSLGAPEPVLSSSKDLASETWAGAPNIPGPAPVHLSLTASHAEDLILNLRDYPAWRITLNGALDPTRARRPDGLIAIPIPAGASTIDIRYARTRDQTLGDAISLLALAILLYTLVARVRKFDPVPTP